MFLILIAVALFAALSYAVTQSGRGGSGGVGREQATLHASTIIQYFAQIRTAMQRLLLLGGCTDTTLSFENSSFAVDYTNGAAPGDDSCHIFETAGGAVTWQPPPTAAQGSGITEYRFVSGISIQGLSGDPLLPPGRRIVAYAVTTREICIAANNMNSVTNPSGAPPTAAILETDIATSVYTGDPTPITFIFGNGAYTPELQDKDSGCFQTTWAGENKYVFYSSLYASD